MALEKAANVVGAVVAAKRTIRMNIVTLLARGARVPVPSLDAVPGVTELVRSKTAISQIQHIPLRQKSAEEKNLYSTTLPPE